MKALQLTQKGFEKENFVLSNDAPIPTPGEDDILIKVVSTALNPIDWKMPALGLFLSTFPIVLGGDASGIVESVGSKVTKFQKGDEIAGFTLLGRPSRGPFAEYALVPEKFAIKKPSSVGFEEASTLPIGVLTAAVGLHHHLKLPFPSKSQGSGDFILIWGASGSVGTFAVQLANLAGFKVIAAASPRNFEYLKSLGATHVVDHSAPDVASQIQSLTNSSLKHAFNAFGSSQSSETIVSAFTSSGASHLASVGDFGFQPPAHVTLYRVALGAGGEPADFYHQVCDEVASLLAEKKFQPNRVEKLPNGLAGVFEGLAKLKENNVSGVKLVANIAETP